jgi:hypothetical protein
MGQGHPQPRHPPTPRDHTNGTVTACFQEWQDAELAMYVARRCFDRWLQASPEDTPTMRAYHTHEALHEAARAIALLIETFRVEATARATTTAGSTNGHRK